MRRAALLLLALAACDDESLPARVAAAQIHGITAAAADCYVEDTHQFFPPGGQGTYIYTFGYRLKTQRLVDGSAFFYISARSNPSGSPVPDPDMRFCERGSDCAAGVLVTDTDSVTSFHTGGSNPTQITAAFQDGLVSVTVANPDFAAFNAPTTIEWVSESIETVCTGFNLEAFGVE